VAKLLGKSDDFSHYSGLAAAAKKQWDATFWNTTTETYGSGYQTDLILSLWIEGLVPDAKRDKVVNLLLKNIIIDHKNHLATGIVGTKYLFPLLSSLNQTALAYTVVTQDTFPSYGYMIANGATTLWENWQGSTYTAFGSRNHIMFGTQSSWFFKALGGIDQDITSSVAYGKIVVHPLVDYIPLTSAASSVITTKGLIESSWIKKGTLGLDLNVQIPVNTDATVYISKLGQDSVTISEMGKIIWQGGKFVPGDPGITGGAENGNDIVLEIGSGKYQFSAQV